MRITGKKMLVIKQRKMHWNRLSWRKTRWLIF